MASQALDSRLSLMFEKGGKAKNRGVLNRKSKHFRLYRVSVSCMRSIRLQEVLSIIVLFVARRSLPRGAKGNTELVAENSRELCGTPGSGNSRELLGNSEGIQGTPWNSRDYEELQGLP